MTQRNDFLKALQAERESIAALESYVTVAFEEQVDEDGYFRVGLLRPDGSVLHTVLLRREPASQKLDLRLKYGIPAVGSCEVHIVIRLLAPEPDQNPVGAPLDDYGFNDYR